MNLANHHHDISNTQNDMESGSRRYYGRHCMVPACNRTEYLQRSEWRTSLTSYKADRKFGYPETEVTHGLPEIDYRRSLDIVYQDFVKHEFNITDRGVNCLSVFEDRSMNGLMLSGRLPSWALDLGVDMPRYQVPPETVGFFEGDSLNGVNFSLTADIIPKQDYARDGELVLQGRKVGAIVSEHKLKMHADGFATTVHVHTE